jgi:signal transduction histidine kinase/ActR/RegA family two-component response regulator
MAGPVNPPSVGRAEATRLFVEIAPVPMALVDLGGRIVAISASAAADASPDAAAPGAPIHNLYADADGIIDAMRGALGRGEIQHAQEGHVRAVSGNRRWMKAQSSFGRDDAGQVLGVLMVLQTLSAVDEAELASREAAATAVALAQEARARFLAQISHGIRTPLNGVIGMAQAMARGDLAPAQRDQLDVIRRSGDTLLAVLNEVIDLSSLESGRLEVAHRDFDLADTVRDACGPVEALSCKKGLAFRLILEGEAGWRRGDAVRLRQIVSNLVGNALKFTHVGAIGVTLRATADDFEIRVVDTGVGMTPDMIEQILAGFEARAQGPHRLAGSGLGLAVSRELVALMGGRMTIDSAPDVGSSFTVAFPFPRIGRAEATPANDHEVSCGPLRVLAVEDNETNRLVLRAVLEQVGVEVTIVENGAEAIEAWAAGGWDAILMDVQMPVMDGQTATAEIRRRELGQEVLRTPIIAVTANAMAHQVAEYLAGGMDAVVAKPIEVQALLETLARVVADEAPVAARG